MLELSIDKSGNCYVDSDSAWVGWVAFSRNEYGDPTPKDPTFHPMNGTSAPVWIRNTRPDGLIGLITQSDGCNVTIQINQESTTTSSGPLRMTEEQLRQTAELSIRLSRMK
ncbi:hypothetical protein ACQP0C_32105 [Nocardia sp. CA-129566]|uniref:hypothetical protein n=1 Tax=Nocardia sp. CA-129566 TaxID=3239976 RepID=UPI003D98E78B